MNKLSGRRSLLCVVRWSYPSVGDFISGDIMNELTTDKFTCKVCHQPFYFGWESLDALRDFLLIGVTRRGKDGSKTFKWIKCSHCKTKYKISGLGL